MRNVLLKIAILHFWCLLITAQTPAFEFWIKAEKTLLLSELRAQSIHQAPTVDDPVIASPRFLPLCGNGKVDTKDDCANYYQNRGNPLLRLKRKQSKIFKTP
jgi:hypothetical protein